MSKGGERRAMWDKTELSKNRKKGQRQGFCLTGGKYMLGANTPREFGRRLGCIMAVLVIILQLVRVYLKHEIARKNAEQEAWFDGQNKMHFENHTCHTRDHPRVDGCSPLKCARVVIDDFVTQDECSKIIQLAEFGMAKGGGAGGATILDLPSGALSYGDQFINLHQMLAKRNESLPQDSKLVLKDVMARVRHRVSDFFGVSQIQGTTPRFISRMDQKPAKTMHDEYWHEHVDANQVMIMLVTAIVTGQICNDVQRTETNAQMLKHGADQYPGFEYTALLYLNNQGAEYTGGKFSFIDPAPNSDSSGKGQAAQPKVSTLVPRCGRLIFFTSGPENVHRVHKVESGKRYALTIAFTCDSDKALTGEWDPK